MADQKPRRKPRDTEKRKAEYARAKKARQEAAQRREVEETFDPFGQDAKNEREAEIKIQLVLLAKRTSDLPTDADRDIDFAYRNSSNPAITPLEAPSLGAWQWYEFAKADPIEFLKICAKREDAKAKAAGTITSQRMEDDKRQQFAVIERIRKQLKLDVDGIIDDMMAKFPRDVLRRCRKHDAAWKAFIAEECQ